MENEKEWLETIKNNMKKKKTINLNDSKVYLKKKLPQSKATEKSLSSITNKSELYTDRSRHTIKSKSPLAERDTNAGKKKPTMKTTTL